MIMAGGTGGHVFPALAVADALRASGWRVVWLGNPDGMEATLVPKHGYELRPVKFGGLRGKGLVTKLLLPFNLLRAFWQSLAACAACDRTSCSAWAGTSRSRRHDGRARRPAARNP